MEDMTISACPPLDTLFEKGPTELAWLGRIYRELARLYPDLFVFRIDAELDELTEWLAAQTDVTCVQDETFSRIEFDDDRDGPRGMPEGGWLSFEWRGQLFRVVACRARRNRWDYTYTWVVGPDRRSADTLVDAVARWQRTQRSEAMVFEEGEWEEAPRLESALTAYTWDSVVLPEQVRSRIRRAAELFFASEKTYAELGVPWKLGFLFVGPPGTGKTLTTKVLAATCGQPFLYVRGFTGSRGNRPDASTLREIFQGARDRAPCVLCLEDVDSLVTEELRSTFLNELDGLEDDYRGVLTVATTNHPEKLDEALLYRPSRFDYRFEFPLPDEGQRRAFIGHWVDRLRGLGYVEAPDTVLEEVVRRSRGMSQAYLKRVLVGTVLRMQSEELRGDAAFSRLVLEELDDSRGDRATAHRSRTVVADAAAGVRFGFHPD